jgi:hypothetical protein
MRLAGLFALIPPELIPLMMVCGGLFMIIGLKRLSYTLFILCGVLIVAPVILEPLLAELPEWALYLIIIYFWLSIAAMIIALLIGERAWDGAKGQMTANVITWFFLAPFRLVGLVLGRVFFRRH